MEGTANNTSLPGMMIDMAAHYLAHQRITSGFKQDGGRQDHQNQRTNTRMVPTMKSKMFVAILIGVLFPLSLFLMGHE